MSPVGSPFAPTTRPLLPTRGHAKTVSRPVPRERLGSRRLFIRVNEAHESTRALEMPCCGRLCGFCSRDAARRWPTCLASWKFVCMGAIVSSTGRCSIGGIEFCFCKFVLVLYIGMRLRFAAKDATDWHLRWTLTTARKRFNHRTNGNGVLIHYKVRQCTVP
jgi:hypothetical protein